MSIIIDNKVDKIWVSFLRFKAETWQIVDTSHRITSHFEEKCPRTITIIIFRSKIWIAIDSCKTTKPF